MKKVIGISFGGLEHSKGDFWCCRCIKVVVFEGAIHKIRRGRVTRTDEIPVDFWKNVIRHVWSG